MTRSAPAPRHVVNWATLAADLDTACHTRLRSRRDVARELGMAASCLTRLAHGRHLTADGLAALVAWLYPHHIPQWITDSSARGETHE